MTNKIVYLKGKARYIRPYFCDTGENLPDGDLKAKLQRTEGQYNTMVVLPFTNRDEAEEHLNSLGIPTDGMMGNLLKRNKLEDGTVEVVYKITRPHMEPSFKEDPIMGPPKVVDADGNEWDPEVLIGNGSDITVKLNVWIGTKAKKVRWDGIRVDTLVEYTKPEGEGF